jgi:hypothetical protein
VKAAGNYAVTVRFESGKTFTVDLRELVHGSRGLKRLRDAEVIEPRVPLCWTARSSA